MKVLSNGHGIETARRWPWRENAEKRRSKVASNLRPYRQVDATVRAVCLLVEACCTAATFRSSDMCQSLAPLHVEPSRHFLRRNRPATQHLASAARLVCGRPRSRAGAASPGPAVTRRPRRSWYGCQRSQPVAPGRPALTIRIRSRTRCAELEVGAAARIGDNLTCPTGWVPTPVAN